MFRKMVKRLLTVFLILAMMGGMLPGPDYTIKAYAGVETSGNWSSSEYITEPALSDTIYTVDSAGDLAWIASQVNSGNKFSGFTFDLTANIDLSEHYWTPIGCKPGSTAYEFKGIFNGNNKVISGLTIGSPAAPDSALTHIGLFGYVNTATITGINLEGINIYSSRNNLYAGGLVGEIKGVTTISDCSATGLVYCSGDGGRIGGILGNYNDYSAGKLTVKNSYSQCAIYSPKLTYAGGFAGYLFSNTIRKTNIMNCFSTGSITGGGYANGSVGGFVGSCQYGNIYNCFSNCTVNGKSCETGGFAGYIYYTGLSNVYAGGMVMNVYTEGGVIGKNSYPNTNPMTNCYWNSTVNSGITTYGVGNAASNDYTAAFTQDYMQSSDFLSDLNDNAAALVTAGNTDILSWELETGKNDGYPRLSGIGAFNSIYKPAAIGGAISGTVRVKETLTLSYDYLDYNGFMESGSTIRWYRSDNADGSEAGQIPGADGKTYVLAEADLAKYIFADVTPSNGHTTGDTANTSCTAQIDVPYFAGGTGVEGDPYIIENLAQLKSLTLFPNAWYRLESDITGLDEVLCDSFVGKGPFNGNFNGNGHKVTIDIANSTGSYLGMLSVIESSGKVYDLNIDGNISGSKNIGSLAGLNKGTISNCDSSAAVLAAGNPASPVYVGGLVSSNMGRVTDCGVAGTLTASGLIGTGTASSRAVFGGIAGENFCLVSDGLITGCYTDIAPFSIDVSGFREVYAGGLVGSNYAGGSVEDSHVVKDMACNLTTGDEASIVRAGGIAGYNYYADILRCYAAGDVTADGKCSIYAGGIAGQCCNGPISQPSTISECYYRGTVSGNGDSNMDTCVGGLVGYFTSGNVNYCYSTCSVSADGGNNNIGNVYAGGLIGYGDKGEMRHCYSRSTGTTEGGSTACNGGLYGGRKAAYGPYISDSYWNTDNTTAVYGDGKNKDSWNVGTALSTINMTGAQAATEMPQLDFETPFFVTRENYQKNWYYPQLRVFAYSTDTTVSGASLESVTEVVYSASISPGTVSFDLGAPEDVSVAVTWNDATAINDIKSGGVSIGAQNYNIDKVANTLTIDKAYLETQPLGTAALIIQFNKSYPTVLNINIIHSVPSITSNPEDRIVTTGETASFAVMAAGDEPLSYQWLKNSSSLSDNGRISGSKTAELTISDAQESDEGSYACFVSNNTGNATSSAATLTVNPAPAAPYITRQPSSSTVNYWQTAVFKIEASGDDPMSYQWRKAGSDISDGGRISGTSTATLTITGAQASDEGSYTCYVSNGAGNETSDEAILTVNLINPAINPSKAVFDLDKPGDISTIIAWGSAQTVTDVVYGSDTAASSAVYSLDEDILTIGKAFLEGLKLPENDTVEFEISFDVGDSAILEVKAARGYTYGNDASLSDLTVGGFTVSGFAADKHDYDVELPYGTLSNSAEAWVDATPADTNASMSIVQASSLPGDASVMVTSEDKNDTNIYIIHFTLAAPPVPTYSLTITAGTGGSITAGVNGSYAAGTIVNIAAAAASNYSFNKWTSTNGGAFADAYSRSTIFTMPSNDVMIKANFTYNGNNEDRNDDKDSSENRTDITPPPSFGNAVVSRNNTATTTLQVNFDLNNGGAMVDIAALRGDIFAGVGDTVITMPPIPGAKNYTVEFPKALLSDLREERNLTFSTGAGSVTLPGGMLAGINGGKAGITIGQYDKSGLPEGVRAAIGDRPVVQLTLTVDGRQTEWSNPDAPVTVSIPYTPTAAELADPEHITIWYIDGSGNVVSIPSGRYDPVTGKVTFSTTHFSNYAVVYVTKLFADLESAAWAKKPIEVLASKGILKDRPEGGYAPHTAITRADFVYALIRTLGADARLDGNFDDISKAAYYYKEIGIAKKLGITSGIGNNKFNPEASITRQDMMVMTGNALRILKKLEVRDLASGLEKFSDRALIAEYAVNSLAAVVDEGLIVGSGDKLDPLGITTRAEAAVFLYRIYNRYIK